MTIPKMEDALLSINKSIERKKASFEVARIEGGFGLAAGSYQVVKVSDGFIVSMRLTREKLEYLKSQCEEALAQ